MIIGLHGKAGSGKDESYRFIKEWATKAGRPARRDAFADRMKVSAAKALGYQGSDEDCIAAINRLKQPGWQIVIVEPGGRIEHPLSGREYIQYYGTEAHRDMFGQDFWIERVTQTYTRHEILVITDVRFPNEAKAIRELGGEIWQVTRPMKFIDEDSHDSEKVFPHYLIDHLVQNNGTLEDLDHAIRHRMVACLGVSVGLVH